MREAGARYDPSTGQVHLFDVNGRFLGNIRDDGSLANAPADRPPVIAGGVNNMHGISGPKPDWIEAAMIGLWAPFAVFIQAVMAYQHPQDMLTYPVIAYVLDLVIVTFWRRPIIVVVLSSVVGTALLYTG